MVRVFVDWFCSWQNVYFACSFISETQTVCPLINKTVRELGNQIFELMSLINIDLGFTPADIPCSLIVVNRCVLQGCNLRHVASLWLMWLSLCVCGFEVGMEFDSSMTHNLKFDIVPAMGFSSVL